MSELQSFTSLLWETKWSTFFSPGTAYILEKTICYGISSSKIKFLPTPQCTEQNKSKPGALRYVEFIPIFFIPCSLTTSFNFYPSPNSTLNLWKFLKATVLFAKWSLSRFQSMDIHLRFYILSLSFLNFIIRSVWSTFLEGKLYLCHTMTLK